MNAVENDVRALVDKELSAANKRFPQFHSRHEGYAVIQEEVDELKEDMNRINGRIVCLWDMVRFNNSCEELVSRIYDNAVNAACEAIQVAAMCKLAEEATPELHGLLVPLCEYCGGVCHEMEPCGRYKRE